MVDIFTLALTHGLLAVALLRMLFRPELDTEQARAPDRPWLKSRADSAETATADD